MTEAGVTSTLYISCRFLAPDLVILHHLCAHSAEGWNETCFATKRTSSTIYSHIENSLKRL